MQALTGQDITIYGDGQQTRSFQYVDDCIDGLIKLMGTEDTYTGPVNIGNPQEFTILELAEKVIRMTGTQSKIVYKDLPADDPLQRKPDITKAILDLRWQPYVELHEGLTLTINYFKKL
jgi:UDP-glucuronate decarboxylase